jgi:hypothetical protein
MPKGLSTAGPLVARCYMATLGRLTPLSAARYFPLVFIRVNKSTQHELIGNMFNIYPTTISRCETLLVY